GAADVLIEQDRDAVLLGQQPHDLANRSLAVDDDVPGAAADFLEQRVEPRVVQRPREDADRLEAKRMGDRMQLPESEMTRDEQDALALSVGQAHPLFAVEV